MHGVISLPGATSYDKAFYLICSVCEYCIPHKGSFCKGIFTSSNLNLFFNVLVTFGDAWIRSWISRTQYNLGKIDRGSLQIIFKSSKLMTDDLTDYKDVHPRFTKAPLENSVFVLRMRKSTLAALHHKKV